MNDSTDVWAAASARLAQGDDFCLATLVRQVGSAPRATGAAMLVFADGGIAGTIGGGGFEAGAIRRALACLAEGRSERWGLSLTGLDVADSQMICGGEVEAYLEPWRAADPAARELAQCLAGLKAGDGYGVLVSRLAPGPEAGLAGRKTLLTSDGRQVGRLAGGEGALMAARALMGAGLAAGRLHDDSWYLEPVLGKPTVYIIGAGHVAQQIAPLAGRVGFRVVVADDRPEFASSERFPEADEVRVLGFEGLLAALDPGPQSYVIIVTRGHVHDYEVLAQALARPGSYLGMIGSRRKRGAIFRALLEQGVSQEELARVHSPIGLDIGAETPEEIAVSIVAELIAVRSGSYRSELGMPV